MPRSNRFDQAIQLLKGQIRGSSFTLPATDGGISGRVSAADLSKALVDIVKLLPDRELGLKSPEEESDASDESKWSLGGEPVGAWPVPGFPRSTLELSGSKAALKVTDKGNDKDCEYELGFTGKIEIGVKIPIAVTLSEKGKFKAVAGDAKGKSDVIRIDPISLSEKFYIPGLSDALKAVSQLIRLDAVGLMSATVSGTIDAETKEATVTGIIIVGSVTFAGVGVQLQISFAQGADSKLDRSHPNLAITWPSADDPDWSKKSIKLSAILKEIGVGFAVPEVLDVTFKSFTLEHKWIAEKDQLNKNDTRRLQLQAPSGKNPDLLITGSFDENGKKRVTARLGWGKFSLKQLPLVGDHLPGEFEPLFLLMTSQKIGIKDIGKLCSMKDFDLETLGTPEEKLEKAPPLGGGIHVTGIFNAGEAVEVPFHFGLFAKKHKPPELLGDGDEPEALVEDEEPAQLPVQKSVGPVTLQSLTFKFESGKVSILLNLALRAGGLTIELLGLRAAFAISDKSPSFGIDGGILTYSSSTVQIGGGFVRDTSGQNTDWIGTALLRVGDAFALNAAVAFSDGDPKKLFLFAYTHRQLGGPPSFYITGLAGGFGYNRSLVVPAVDQVNNFPMIAMANSLSRGGDGGLPEKFDATAMWKIVSGIGKYLPPSPSGTMFGAFGITFTSFGYIKSTLLAAMIWGSGEKFVLLGSSTVDAPKDKPVAHADLQIVATADAEQVKVDAILGPESYILDKKCRLTGGFAVYCWYGRSKHSGDLVVTLGGYNPGYDKPDHYPAVPRLGFVWKVGDDTQVNGFAYFAFTPKSIQVGGGLNFTIDADPLRVWGHAEAHFWVNWQPFYYKVRGYVDFGISFRMDLLFCSVTVTADISIDLKMWGPAFSGRAEVHLWFVSFTTTFGEGASETPPTKSWNDFLTTFVTPPAPKGMLGADAPSSCLEVVSGNGIATAPAGTVISGGPFNGKKLDWFADPQQTRLTITSTVPAQNARFNDAIVDPKQTITIYARPVTKDKVTSPLINPGLTVTMKSDAGTPIPLGATAVLDQFAAAMWGPAEEASKGSEMVPGIRGVALAPSPIVPSKSVAIDMDVLLFAASQPIALRWERPTIPTATFDWATRNPFDTINALPVVQARTTMLNDLLSLGYLRPGGAAIDVSNVKKDQPCFMERPRLCSLGTDRTGA